MDEKILERFEERITKMRVFILFLLINSLFADNNIQDIIKQKYNSYNLSYSFNRYVDRVVDDFKKPEDTGDGWFEKTKNLLNHGYDAVKANYGVNTKDVATNMMNDVFYLYGRDLNSFVNEIISDDVLIEEIKRNYNTYISESSEAVYNELDYGYKDKFLSLYNSNTLNVLLKEDIKEKILQTKEKILKNIQDEVSGSQPTTLIVAGGMIISGAIMRTVANQIKKKTIDTAIRRIVGKGTMKVGSKWIPIIGEVMIFYEIATLNQVYEDIGDDIKEEFHNNEDIIINNIADTLADIDNISSKYQASISMITADYILKAKVPYTFLFGDLKEEVQKSKNYIFLEILESFYQVPEEFYSYIVAKYMSLPDDQKHQFAEYVANLDDKFALENVMVIENELKLKISLENYGDAVEFFDRFEDKEEVYRFFSFMPSVQKSTINLSKVKSFYYPYDLLKSDAYLLKRYALLKPADREKMLKAVKAEKTNFERIAYFEEKNNLTVSSEEFVAMAELLNRFKGNEELDKFVSVYKEHFGVMNLKQFKEYLISNTYGKYLMILIDIYTHHKVVVLLLLFLLSGTGYYLFRQNKNKGLIQKDEILLLEYKGNDLSQDKIKNEEKEC